MMNMGNQIGGTLMRTNNESCCFKYLRISSKEISAQYMPYNFTFNIGNDARIDRCMYIQPISCIFPNLGENISSTLSNNTFNLICNGIVRTVTIPNGYYNSSELMAYIQSAINAYVGAGFLTITMSNHRFLWTSTGIIALTYANNPMASTLGFTQNIGSVSTFISPNVPNLTGSTVLYIHSNTVSNNATYINSSNNNVNDTNGLLTIPINCAYGGQQIYNFNETQKFVMGSSGTPVRQIVFTLRTNGGRLYTELTPNQEFILVLKIFLM